MKTDDVRFAVVRRGYDRAQVDQGLTDFGAQLDAAVAARDAAITEARSLGRQLDTSRGEAHAARAAVEQARAEVDRLRTQVAELSVVPSTVDGMSERLQQMVRIAQDEVNDMRSRATTSATQVLTLAQAEADELRDRSRTERDEFDAERQVAETALRSQLEESRARLDQLRNDSDGQQARLTAELAERRARAEDEFAAEMEQRRSGLLSGLAAQEARRRDEATRIVEMAVQEARGRMADATEEAQRVRAEARAEVDAGHRELGELRALQHQVAEQLTSVRSLLDWTLPQIGAAGPRPLGNGHASPLVAALPAASPTVEVPAETGLAEEVGGGTPEHVPAADLAAGPAAVPSDLPAEATGEPASPDRPKPTARPGRTATSLRH